MFCILKKERIRDSGDRIIEMKEVYHYNVNRQLFHDERSGLKLD